MGSQKSEVSRRVGETLKAIPEVATVLEDSKRLTDIEVIAKAAMVPEVPDDFLDERWFEIQSADNPIPTIDFEGFLRWYQANQFVENLLVGKPLRLVRDVARRHGLGFANVERIYRVFVEFDEDESNCIDLPEFRKLVCRLLSVEKSEEISDVMFRHLWMEAAGQSLESISFEAFLLWYNRHFGEDLRSGQGAALLREYYSSLCPFSMLSANSAELHRE